jgi:ubiquinone/menaquinone biosynthesis C-methylase UbiE
MEMIYGELSLDKIPWFVEETPNLLIELIDKRWIKPCKAIDLGCGVGNYARWFAKNGFDMTGVDISENAIKQAINLSNDTGIKCQFVNKNMIEIISEYENLFDFAYDWEVLHHIYPENRKTYISNVHRFLRSGGKYFSLCFSDNEPITFGGSGKYRKTPIGTTLYFSSEEELRELFTPFFEIEELSTIAVKGKNRDHIAIKSLLKKKDA